MHKALRLPHEHGQVAAASSSRSSSALQAQQALPQQAAAPPPPPAAASALLGDNPSDAAAQPEKQLNTVAEPVCNKPQPGSDGGDQVGAQAEQGGVAASSPDARQGADPPRPAEKQPARLSRGAPEVTPAKETAKSPYSDATPQFMPRSGSAGGGSARASTTTPGSSDSARLKCRVTGEPFSLQEDQQPVELPCCGTLVSVAGAKKVCPPTPPACSGSGTPTWK